MTPSSVKENYYHVLEVPRSVDTATIRTSYKPLAKLWHPDKNKGSAESTAEFLLLHTAYETLSDSTRRQVYDRRYQPAHTHSRNARSSCSRGTTHSPGCPHVGTRSPNSDDYRKRRRELYRKLARHRVEHNACESRYVAIHSEADELRAQVQRITERLARAKHQMQFGQPVRYHLDRWITGQYAEKKILEEKLGKCTIESINIRSRLTALDTAIRVMNTFIAESMCRGAKSTRWQS